MKIKGKLLVGITGGIGSGKSEVSKMLARRGFKIYNADQIAKNLYISNKSLANKIVKYFGKDVLNYKGKINLSKLKELIFSSKKNYEAINKIVHPVVIKQLRDDIKKSNYEIAIIEAALIFESGLDKYLDMVIMVYANKKSRVERLMIRDESTRREILDIMDLQMDEKKKLEKADFVIINNKSIDDLKIQIDFLGKILKSISKNVI
jgi:dephospho-CoA kinase